MSLVESFRIAWKANKFITPSPDVKSSRLQGDVRQPSPPDLPCLREVDASQSLSERRRRIQKSVGSVLRKAELTIQRLESDLEKERFVVAFLREVISTQDMSDNEKLITSNSRKKAMPVSPSEALSRALERAGKCDYPAPVSTAAMGQQKVSISPIPPVRHKRKVGNCTRVVYEEVIPSSSGSSPSSARSGVAGNGRLKAKSTAGLGSRSEASAQKPLLAAADSSGSSVEELSTKVDRLKLAVARSADAAIQRPQPTTRSRFVRSAGPPASAGGGLTAAAGVRKSGVGLSVAPGRRNPAVKSVPPGLTTTSWRQKFSRKDRTGSATSTTVSKLKAAADVDTSRRSQQSQNSDDDDDDVDHNGLCSSPSFDVDDEAMTSDVFDNGGRKDMSLLHQSCPENEKLQMRKWVVKSILDSEKTYLGTLDVLLQLMQTFRNLLSTDEPVLAAADIETIFCKVADLHEAHDTFVNELQPRVENWSDEQEVAEPVKVLALMEYRVASDYLTNYQKAVSTINKCWKENQAFADMTKEIAVQGMSEKQNLEQMLYTPVVRFQRNNLVLHDLINCTPTGHPDYDPLQKTLIIAQQLIENFDETSERDNSPTEQRYLAKHGLAVEKVGESRKLRLLLLFNDVLVCADSKRSLKQAHIDVKWFIPLIDVSLDDRVNEREEKELADRSQQDIKQLQRAISELQFELRAELKLSKNVDEKIKRQPSVTTRSKIAKIKKKLMDQQLAMIKASPKLMFKVHDRRHNKQRTLLLASDYERANWRTAISDLLGRARATSNITMTDMQNLLSSKQMPKLKNLIPINDLSVDEELLFGLLNLTIGGLQGVTETRQSSDVYCTVEIDSFGHFSTKAKTKAVSVDSTWNEIFEIELEGTQIVRVLVYQTSSAAGCPVGMCALTLSKEWLTTDVQEKTLSINKEMSLTISLGFTSRSREQTLVRQPTTSSRAVFGADIKDVQKQEGSNVPFVIATCIKEIESRGLTDEGLYRICGSSPEIQKLKKAFEKHSKSSLQLTKEAEIPVLAGLVKLYFRELPESLFTDVLYKELSKAMGLSDPDMKQALIVQQLKLLPEPNHSTVVCIIDHILRVASLESENRMSIRNLAVVFGPTLLRAPVRETTTDNQTMDQLLTAWSPHDVVLQTNILYSVLELRTSGICF